jgi:hypothetical protein
MRGFTPKEDAEAQNNAISKIFKFDRFHRQKEQEDN